MVIMTAKLSKGKLIAALLIILAVVVATIVICTSESEPPQSDLATQELTAVTNDDRLAFLASFGWSVGVDPVSTQQVRIPTEASEVFDRYNELQQSQGFDLTQYAGQTVEQYVYQVLNYEAVPSASAETATTSGFAAGQQASDFDVAEGTTQSADSDEEADPAQDSAESSTATQPEVTVTNTEDTPVYATILVCNGVIIGGDICSADPTGIMHGFAKP